MGIELYSFGAFTAGSPNLSLQYSSQAIIGEILKVTWDLTGGTTNGSLFIAISGTNESVWVGKNITADTTIYPEVVPVDSVNVGIGSQAVALGGNQHSVKRIAHAPLWIAASGVDLGATGSGINNVHVWYRRE